MPAAPVPPEIDAFLQRANPAIVASLRPDGSPHTAATWYDWDTGRILLNMDRSRVRVAYLEHDPRVALTVLDGPNWHRHVSLNGRIERIEDDADLADIDRLSLRYTSQPYPNRDGLRVSAWVRVESWHSWNL
jgi:PPOX class probable F420-dependent enzyme